MKLFFGTFGIRTPLSTKYYQPIAAESLLQAERKMRKIWGKNHMTVYTNAEFNELLLLGNLKGSLPLPTLYATRVMTVGDIKWLTDRFENIVYGPELYKKKRLENMLLDVTEAYNDDPYAEIMKESIKEVLDEVS